MSPELCIVGGMITLIMWMTADYGLKSRFAHFKSQNASIDVVLADFEVMVFYICREVHKYFIKVGLGALLYYLFDGITSTDEGAIESKMLLLVLYLLQATGI